MNFHNTRGALQLTLPGVCIAVIISSTVLAAEYDPKLESPLQEYSDCIAKPGQRTEQTTITSKRAEYPECPLHHGKHAGIILTALQQQKFLHCYAGKLRENLRIKSPLQFKSIFWRGLWGKHKCMCLHTQCLFALHWGISANASLNLNPQSLCMSLIVTFHHPLQLVSPGLQFDEGRFPPFLTKSTA